MLPLMRSSAVRKNLALDTITCVVKLVSQRSKMIKSILSEPRTGFIDYKLVKHKC